MFVGCTSDTKMFFEEITLTSEEIPSLIYSGAREITEKCLMRLPISKIAIYPAAL